MVCSKVPFSWTDRRYRLTVRAEVPILRVELGMEDYGTLLRGVGLLRRPGQWRHVLRLVSAWHWLGRQCVSGPRRTIRRRPYKYTLGHTA